MMLISNRLALTLMNEPLLYLFSIDVITREPLMRAL